MFSLVIPVYGNEGSIPELLDLMQDLDNQLDHQLEVVFVIDASPDRSAEILRERLPNCQFASSLVILSRNFGSFAAIRAGLAEATGPYFAVMAADLQEPPELILEFFRTLESEPVDVTIGTRAQRSDPLLSRWSSQTFWFLYRKFVQRDMPAGGVDIFGCNLDFRDRLLALGESNSSLVGLIFWLGFRRKFIPYQRQPRRHGKSAWKLGARFRYLMDSIFAFSDLPVRLLLLVGAAGLVFSTLFALIVIVSRLLGYIEVPGYAAVVLAITFFGALNLFVSGVIGSYVWRSFENTKARPQVIVMSLTKFAGKSSG